MGLTVRSVTDSTQDTKIVLFGGTDRVLDNLAAGGAPGMEFEAIHRPSGAEAVTGSTELAPGGSHEGRDGQGLGVDNDEIQFLDFGGELLDHERQPGEPNAGLEF